MYSQALLNFFLRRSEFFSTLYFFFVQLLESALTG